jgi:TolB-like protein/TPR repeat protein
MPEPADEASIQNPTSEGTPPAAPGQVAAHHLAAGHHHGHAQLPHWRFLEEIKRRNVGRVAILYIVVSYVVLEVFEMFFHLLEMPAWSGRIAVLIAVIGFPIALLLAWAYEITPEGLKPTDEVPPKQSITRQTGRRLDRAIAIVLAIALSYFVVDKFWLSKHPSVENSGASLAPAQTPALPVIPEKSVAVLPFVDMSEKKDEEYFSDGLSEELIDRLAHAANLKVIARTSSFQFKGKNEDMRTIGQRLGVANLLEGSVRKAGNTLRITVQLVRADTGFHLWSDTYDRKADDIFKIQDEIATAVLQALKASLIEGSANNATGTQNTMAYDLFLQGHSIDRSASSGADYERAIHYYRRALEADPNYAQAWADISAAVAEEAENGFAPMEPARKEARHAAERALELAPSLSEAHVAMARYLIVDELDVVGGEREVKRALALEPNNQWALAWAGTLETMRGQFQDAAAHLQMSIVSDPVNPWRHYDLAQEYYFSGNYSQALNTFRTVVDLLPTFGSGHLFTAQILLAQGKPLLALAEADRESDEDLRLGCECRALALDALGRKAEADPALTYLIKKHADDNAYGIALVYAGRGDLEQAFNWLDRAYRQRDPGLLDVRVDPLLRNVQSDPRFAELLKKLGLMN